MRCQRETYTSNLINDESMAAQFNEEAFNVARSMRTKYYSLFEFFSEDDIVMECWDKILRQDIGFDDTKKCKFSSFVRMMVNNRCIDMCRKIQKHEGVCSLDATFSSGTSPDESSLTDFVPDVKCMDEYEGIEVHDVVLSLDNDMGSLPVQNIMSLLEAGYKSKDIQNMLNCSAAEVKAVKKMGGMLKRRFNGTSQSLDEVLYGDEETLMMRKEELLGSLCYVRDGNLRLSDIIELVIDGFSFKGISEKLRVPERRVRTFLEGCYSIQI